MRVLSLRVRAYGDTEDPPNWLPVRNAQSSPEHTPVDLLHLIHQALAKYAGEDWPEQEYDEIDGEEVPKHDTFVTVTRLDPTPDTDGREFGARWWIGHEGVRRKIVAGSTQADTDERAAQLHDILDEDRTEGFSIDDIVGEALFEQMEHEHRSLLPLTFLVRARDDEVWVVTQSHGREHAKTVGWRGLVGKTLVEALSGLDLTVDVHDVAVGGQIDEMLERESARKYEIELKETPNQLLAHLGMTEFEKRKVTTKLVVTGRRGVRFAPNAARRLNHFRRVLTDEGTALKRLYRFKINGWQAEASSIKVIGRNSQGRDVGVELNDDSASGVWALENYEVSDGFPTHESVLAECTRLADSLEQDAVEGVG